MFCASAVFPSGIEALDVWGGPGLRRGVERTAFAGAGFNPAVAGFWGARYKMLIPGRPGGGAQVRAWRDDLGFQRVVRPTTARALGAMESRHATTQSCDELYRAHRWMREILVTAGPRAIC